MIDDIRQNINTEIEILREISNYLRRIEFAGASEKKLLINAVNSLRASAKMINNSLPKLLEEVTIVKKLPRKEAATQLEKVEFERLDSKIRVVLKAEDREKFFKELSIEESIISRIKGQKDSEKQAVKPQSTRNYLKISNRFFLRTANNLIGKGYFNSLALNLRKANIDVLLSSYIACIFFSALLAFVFSIFLVIFLFFFSIHLTSPYFSLYTGEDYLMRFLKLLWLPVVLPIATFAIFYFYPSSEKGSLSKKIDQELPFAVIHMSAISSSGIEPSQIFKIIGTSKEYPYIGKEIRKILNQINLYGYDLVTALKNVSRSTSSKRLAELFSGICTTITSGGDLSQFFEKRAESLLVIYRLDREKYTRSSETFMDIYISVVIAAPMILMILMVMLQVLNAASGFSSGVMVLIVGAINLLFLVFLDLKQPAY
ncbi:MAG: type II secretion system F family protein [Nanoarchaeota archaeon]